MSGFGETSRLHFLMAASIGGLYLANLDFHWIVQTQHSYRNFTDPATMPFLFALLGVFGLLVMPLSNGLSRAIEYQADEYALQATHKVDAQSFGYRPLLQGNTLFLSYVTPWGNEVYALEAASGQILWHHEMGSDNPQHAPILLAGIFCLQQNDDSIDAWRGSDGLHLWHAVPLPSTDQI